MTDSDIRTAADITTAARATSGLDAAPPPTAPDPLDRAGMVRAAAEARSRFQAEPSAALRVKALVARAQATVPARAFARFSATRGQQFSASNAYFALFSVFSMLTVAFAVFGFVLRGNPGLQARVEDVIAQALPGILDSGLVSLDGGLPGGGGLTLAVIIGSVALLLTAVGWINALAQGLRAVAGRPSSGGNPVVVKLSQFAVMVVLGLAVLASAVLSAVSGQARSLLAGIGVDTESLFVSGALSVAGFVLAVLVDACVVVAVFRLAGRLRFGFAVEREAALLAALGLGVLKTLGTALLGGASANPLLAAAAVLVGLLIWFNLIGRVILLSACWATVRWVDRNPPAPEEVAAAERPRGLASTAETGAVRTPRAPAVPTYSPRAGERTSALAGAVLGAAAVIGVRAVGSGIRGAWRLVRGR